MSHRSANPMGLARAFQAFLASTTVPGRVLRSRELNILGEDNGFYPMVVWNTRTYLLTKVSHGKYTVPALGEVRAEDTNIAVEEATSNSTVQSIIVNIFADREVSVPAAEMIEEAPASDVDATDSSLLDDVEGAFGSSYVTLDTEGNTDENEGGLLAA